MRYLCEFKTADNLTANEVMDFPDSGPPNYIRRMIRVVPCFRSADEEIPPNIGVSYRTYSIVRLDRSKCYCLFEERIEV